MRKQPKEFLNLIEKLISAFDNKDDSFKPLLLSFINEYSCGYIRILKSRANSIIEYIYKNSQGDTIAEKFFNFMYNEGLKINKCKFCNESDFKYS